MACGSESKQDAKGQVDESEPPSVPTAHGKSDDAAKTVNVNVQSPHPYTNNLDKSFAVPLNLPFCAKTARLHFKVLRTEANYDFVTVGNEEFSGDRDNTWTEWFTKTGNTVNVRLETDGSISRHGFEIDKVEWDGLPDSCAHVSFPPCAAGTVDLAKRPGTCECPVQPICQPIASVVVSHHMYLGFDNTTKRVTGGNATFTHPGPVEQPITENIGTVDTVRLAALVRRAAATGLLQGASYTKPVTVGTYNSHFRIKAGAHDITFAAGQGKHSAVVQALISDFEALFTCEGNGGLTCGNGFTCEEGTCVAEQSCVCSAQYDPVCGVDGHTYSNACTAGCANAPVAHAGECGIPGDFCGGMLGTPCADDNRCRYGESTWTAPHPDASGTCVAPDYCDAPADCNGLPHIAVPGAWACNANACAWQAGFAWKAVTNGHFATANPYANGQSVWHQLYLPAEAQALRLVTTRFRLENTHDKLEVWTWKSGAWTKVRTYTGSAGPSATDEFPGRYHYLRFVSDSSVTDQGVALDAQWR
ncbi:MAG: Kazal-type serine protease inhibitor family protein [Myxococcota bacterium]|nr:hypothetical protein [Deltaproteobacteria bacterium]MDQ3333966.1 Kazal-type serine protease inhibitor family protein [Myxococcota bacterium]